MSKNTTIKPAFLVKKRQYIRKQVLKVPDETASILSDVYNLEYDDGFDLVNITQFDDTIDLVEHCDMQINSDGQIEKTNRSVSAKSPSAEVELSDEDF